MIFGKGVHPGVVGKVPDLNEENVEMQFDYRQVYANLLRDWMLVDNSKINTDIFFKDFINGPKEDGTGNYEPLPLALQVISGVQENFIADRFKLNDCFPNPAHEFTTVSFRLNNTNHVQIALLDGMGRVVKNILNEEKQEGDYSIRVELASLPTGTYFVRLESGFFKETKKVVVTR
jgi:hypothetical protein